MKLFYQLRWYFLKEWRRYFGAVFLLIFISILQLIPPRIIGLIVDEINKRIINFKQLCIQIGLMVCIAIIIYVLRYIWRLWLFGASYNLAVQLRKKFYKKIIQQTQEFYFQYKVGDLLARAINDVDRVVFAAGEGVLTLVDSLVVGLSVLVVMSVEISWELTCLALSPMPIMALIIKKYGEKLYTCFKSSQDSFSSLNNQVQETLSSIRMIKVFGLEEYRSQKFESAVIESGKKNMNVAEIDAKFDPIIYVAIGASNFLSIAGGSWMIFHHKITLGNLTTFIMYLGLMIWPMLALAWMFNIVERGSAAYSRIYSLLQFSSKVPNGIKCLLKRPGKLTINIRSFHYPMFSRFSLKNIVFDIMPGELVGICGPTGSGKSTLLSLIQRHFNITEGEILFQSIPLIDICKKDWYSRLAIVNQTSFLFSDTIAANIALGKPHADQNEIEKVSKLAEIHDEILNFSDGYQTQVGDRGLMLSGGQKQRISIARALLLKSEIVILDDPLSSVDGRTESRILKNLQKWKKNRMMIITSHRLSALINSNKIFVLQKGNILETGTHQELVQKFGWYRDMYYYQKIKSSTL